MKRLGHFLLDYVWPTFLAIAIIAVLALCAWAVPRVFGAQEPRAMRGPVRMNWITVQPALGSNSEFVKFVIGAEYSVIEHKPSGEFDVTRIGSIEFDLLEGTKGVFTDAPQILPNGMAFYPDALIARLVEHAAARAFREHFPTKPEDDERTRLLRP